MRQSLVLFFAFLSLMAGPTFGEGPDDLADKAMELFGPVAGTRRAAVDFFVKRGSSDAAPALILALRFTGHDKWLPAALESLTGARNGSDWFQWMLWQEDHPEITPFPGFDAFQARLYRKIDQNFGLFLRSAVRHEIRLEEIAWGGVVKDGIPALTNPKLLSGVDAKYLNQDDLVFGIEINGDARAYPLRIMDWHEMVNDVVGGVPVSLAYCTLCGSGILFEATVEGRANPFVFGSSGFLYRSNKLMYDTETNSLWNQFTGRPVVGTLTGSGIALKTRPVVITIWSDWLRHHPQTKVLDVDTGFARNYQGEGPYGEYFASNDLMFPARVDTTRLKPKDYVFALRSSGTERAWTLDLFNGGAVINDRAGVIDLVLIGDAATRTVRAYRTDGRIFAKGADPEQVSSADGDWTVGEEALSGPRGKIFPRLPGHIAYWFAWSRYFGDVGELSSPKR